MHIESVVNVLLPRNNLFIMLYLILLVIKRIFATVYVYHTR